MKKKTSRRLTRAKKSPSKSTEVADKLNKTKQGKTTKPEDLKNTKKTKKSEKGTTPKKVVCKRGYKLCKNPLCMKMIYIHQKICPFCGFINVMKNSKKANLDMKQVLEKELDLSKKKLSTKGQLSKIKAFLENDIFNVILV